jgi:hypothetical protein
VGSSSSTSQRRGERHPLKLPAGERVGGALEQTVDRERQGDLLDGPSPRGRPDAAQLERQLDLGSHRGADHLGLGLLGDQAHHLGELGRAVRRGVEAGDLDLPLDGSAMEVRHEAARRPQQRRLARPGPAGHHDELTGFDPQSDCAERVAAGLGVPVGETVDAERRVSHRIATSARQRGRPRAAAQRRRVRA